MAAQTILIAEDDPDIRDGVRILLAGEGYRILEAENGPRALVRGAAEDLHGAHPVFDGKIAGVG